MSEAPRGLAPSIEHNRVGPDYFGYYKSEVADLLSQDDDSLPLSSQNFVLAGVRDNDQSNRQECNSSTGSGSSFCNSIGAGLSDIKKERLKTLLQESAFALTEEVDEMLGPVANICRIQSILRCKKNSGAACDGNARQHPHKRLKTSSSSSLTSAPLHSSFVDCRVTEEDSGYKDMESTGVDKKCAQCHTTKTSKWTTGPEGSKSLCNACGMNVKQGYECSVMKDQKANSFSGAHMGAEEENNEVDDDLQVLMQNDVSKVEETMKKHSDEHFTTLGDMEQKLEGLLDIVMSSCRLMTLAEKHQLQILIQKLPPRNLDRVVEIIQRSKPQGICDEIHVDLEKEDNVTLWRLYYYVEAVENARKLPV